MTSVTSFDVKSRDKKLELLERLRKDMKCRCERVENVDKRNITLGDIDMVFNWVKWEVVDGDWEYK